MKRLVVPLLACVLVTHAQECKPYKKFYHDHERGWFYKEVCEEEKTEKKTTKKQEEKKQIYLTETTLNIPFEELDKMDPDYINELYVKAKKVAIMYPTQHNIKQYQKLVKWITEKSFKFTESWIKTIKTDAELARFASEVPTSSVERNVYFQQKADYKKQILNQFRDRAGLVVLVQQGCPYCEKQKQILQWFKNETGWEYKLVDVSQVPNIVQRFGVARVPDIFLVIKGDNGQPIWTRIGTGLHTKDELKDIILFGLYNTGFIKPEDKNFVLY